MGKASPVRVLFVIDQFTSPLAGTEGQLIQLISNLPRDQFQPELLVLRSSEYVESASMPCKTEVLGYSRVFSLKTWLATFRCARRRRSEGMALCHVFVSDASVICPPVFSLAGIPTLISGRDMGYWYTRTYLWALQCTSRFVRGLVANSGAVKRITVDKERSPAARVKVIYNAYPDVDGNSLPLPRDKRPAVLAEYGLPETGRFAVLVANLREIKRIGDAIKAIATVSQAHSGSHLVLIGGGDQGPCRGLAESLGVPDRVHLLGVRSDVRRVLNVMDVGLLCSKSEGYSNVAVEYMQAQLPVVAPDVGGNSKAVEHAVTRFLYPKGDSGALSAHLTALLEDSAAAKAMGKAGLQRARARHGLQTMIDSHIALHNGVLLNRVGESHGSGLEAR